MSSVSDQLQRNVGRRQDTAVRGDKEMWNREEKWGGRIRERGAGEMTPGWETRSETLRNFVSCSQRDSVTDRDSVVILRASELCKVHVTRRVSLLGQTHSSQLPSSSTHLTMKLQHSALSGHDPRLGSVLLNSHRRVQVKKWKKKCYLTGIMCVHRQK